ncbi:MAG TPA: transglutaminase domain-containing protein [Anaerolineae bacterium]|nr:transglutaminase domain-containing protein [Anaerolineae bacterium]
MNPSKDALDFHARQSFMTDPGIHAERFSELPDGIPALCRVVQGLLIHQYWAGAYGYSIPEDRASEYQIRDVSSKLNRIIELDDHLLHEARPPERRIVGNCRDYAVLLTAMLRHKGIPARTRCGFAAYFRPGWYEDHMICEVWNADEERWMFVDAQLDDLQREAMRIVFDPCDLPRDQFLPGGVAWLRCRRGEMDPNDFGYGDTVGGMPNIRGNLIRDIAFLNRVEILGWDSWGLIEGEDADLNEEDLALLDQAAALTLAGDDGFQELRALYLRDMRLRVPPVVRRSDDTTFTLEDILKGDPSLAKHL